MQLIINSLNKLLNILNIRYDTLILIVVSILIFLYAAEHDAFEVLVEMTEAHEDMELDEVFTLLIISSVNFGIYAIIRYFRLKREIKKRKKTEQELNYLINHDPLTGIANRTLFTKRIAEQLSVSKAKFQPFVVMILDLNKFKRVNDIYGHRIGDLALIEVSKTLSQLVKKPNLCARLGGDEYAILLTNTCHSAELINFISQLTQVLNEPVTIQHYEFDLGASIGITVVDNMQSDVIEVIRKADIAMYAAKKEDSCTWSFFDDAMDDALFERQYLEKELKTALQEKSLDVHFQPVFDLNENIISYFEVLVRWHHPKIGVVSPLTFIQIAEETELIFELGDQVLEKAITSALTWPKSFSIAVNVSAHQIRNPSFVSSVKRKLEKYNFPPERLEIEVTESVIIDEIARAKAVIKELRAMGIRIALDDFGTGYSSLSYLHSFDFDKVKIDREFIQGLKQSSKNRAIVNALARMCEEMGIDLVAEGIETEQHLVLLKDFTCQFGQGFYLGMPHDGGTTLELCRAVVN